MKKVFFALTSIIVIASTMLVSCRKESTPVEQKIAELVFQGDKFVDIVIEPEFEKDSFDIGVETKARERYGDCVRRVYHKMKESAYEHNEMACDLAGSICEALSAVVAIVSCSDR